MQGDGPIDMAGGDVERRLASINRRLAELLCCEPAALTGGGVRSLEDRIWVWGIVGGKEVGKSTLINALAGREVVDRGSRVGEGTRRPAAYLADADAEALRARFAQAGVSVAYHTEAPESMRGLVLVDLPDFDSLFREHVDQVRRVAGALDGIIWVTTPKKVGDLRAIREMRRVLKARANFVYVVNKMDWLLGQSDGDAAQALERVEAALAAQVGEQAWERKPERVKHDGAEGTGGAASDTHNDEKTTEVERAGRTFLISAKHPGTASMLEAVARSRGLDDAVALRGGNGASAELAGAVDRVAGEFGALRAMLTSAPTAEAAAANKRANLVYQTQRQARAMLEHYDPRAVLDRMDRHVSPDAVDEVVAAAFPAGYCDGVIDALHEDRSLIGKWAAELFERRIAHWPLLGWIAWPAALIVSAVVALRSALGRRADTDVDDVFRRDGLSLEERLAGAVAGVAAAVGRVSRRWVVVGEEDANGIATQGGGVGVEFTDGDPGVGLRLQRGAAGTGALHGMSRLRLVVPTIEVLARELRGEVRQVVAANRAAVIGGYLARRPLMLGRLVRWMLPISVLIWFPLVQPMLSTMLGAGGMAAAGQSWMDRLAVVVEALSGTNVLVGLGVSVLILGMLVAGVYSGAVRDAVSAVDRLGSMSRDASTSEGGLVESVARRIDRPARTLRAELGTLTKRLERVGLAGGRRNATREP